jgi:hypothetical protein
MKQRGRTALRAAAAVMFLLNAATLIGQQTGASSAGQAANATMPSIFIRILPDRMEPSVVTVKPGPVLIVVQNRSTAPNLKLQLDQVNGGHIKTVPIVGGQRHSLETYTLAAGDYILSEANHREWQCKISVK